MLEAAQRLFSEMDAFLDDVDDLRDRIVGDLKLVDAIATDTDLPLLQAITVFKSAAPDAHFRISEQSPRILQARVRSGELHFGNGRSTTRVKDLACLESCARFGPTLSNAPVRSI